MQSARGRSADTSARSFFQRSNESSVWRSALEAPVSIFRASVAAIAATAAATEFTIPAVSQLSTMPRGGEGKRQRRQGVSCGTILRVAP